MRWKPYFEIMLKKYLLLLIVAIALILTSYFVFVKLTPKGPVKYPNYFSVEYEEGNWKIYKVNK
jgi:capsular polysaccharide biosynthesis protein